MKTLAAACLLFAATTAAHADPAPDCKGMFNAGADLFGQKKLDEAAAMFARAYSACGAGHGFLRARGYVLETQGKLEDAAALYLQEASEPGPTAEAFGNLEHIRDQLSAKTKARIVAMGATADTPVHVRGVDGEYSWARAFTCLGAKALGPTKQSLAKGPHDTILDRLEFTCPGAAATHVVYFDYGGD